MDITDITFESGSEMMLSLLKIDSKSIINAVYSTLSEAISELQISSLHSVVIKGVNLLESELGKAEFEDSGGQLSSMLTLGYITATNLRKDSKFYSEAKYKNALATVWHELYHIYDREKAIEPFINGPLFSYPDIKTIMAGINIWMEFFAVYSTFSICEQEHIYNDFRKAFQSQPYDLNSVFYNTSRLLGYYLHKKRNSICDQLLQEHISDSVTLSNVKRLLESMLERYPAFTSSDFINLYNLLFQILPNHK